MYFFKLIRKVFSISVTFLRMECGGVTDVLTKETTIRVDRGMKTRAGKKRLLSWSPHTEGLVITLGAGCTCSTSLRVRDPDEAWERSWLVKWRRVKEPAQKGAADVSVRGVSLKKLHLPATSNSDNSKAMNNFFLILWFGIHFTKQTTLCLHRFQSCLRIS